MSDNIVIRSADPDRDYDQIVDLTGKTFKGYWEWRKRCRNGYILNGPYDWSATRIAFDGTVLVGHFGVFDLTMRFGCGRLRVAGVGAVTSHPDWQGRGIMKRLASAAVDGLAGEGYHATLLYGIPNFYHRFGYVTAWPDMEWRVESQELPSAEGPDLSELEEVTDWVELAECANRWYEDVAGSAVRPTYRANPREQSVSGRLWRRNGAVAGYLVCGASDGTLYVSDMAGEPEEVLAAARRIAAEKWCRYVVLRSMPASSPYVAAVKKRNYRLTLDGEPNGGPMARVVSLSAALKAMEKELSARVRRNGLARFADGPLVDLSDGREVCRISVRDGAVETAAVSSHLSGLPRIDAGDHAVQLLFGTHSMQELTASGDVTVTEVATVPIGNVLFPRIDPSLPAWDRM